MTKPDIIAGLDMGSSRITCVLAAQDPGVQSIRILSGASVPCRGLKGGVVVSISETARAVTQAMEEAEEKGGEVVGEVYLGVRGHHLQSFPNHGAYNIARTDKEITAEDVANVIENAKAIPMSSDREILHVIPRGFSLDRQKGVPNPVGMEGSLLEVDVHIVTASSSHLNNLIKSVSQAGFRVVEPIYGMLALGEVVVTPEEKELGSLLVDIGGQIISLGLYENGSISFSREITLGSDDITRDLAYALRTSLAKAREIKENHGAAIGSLVDPSEVIAVPGLDGRTMRDWKIADMLDYILPRVQDIFERIKKEVQSSNTDFPVAAVLTGGGSLLRGMTEAAERVMEMQQVRTGLVSREFVTSDEEYMNPVYSTALGLVCYPSLRSWAYADTQPRNKKIWKRRFLSWVQDMF
ncbi:MAG: cell division protein FtsA [bacterium]